MLEFSRAFLNATLQAFVKGPDFIFHGEAMDRLTNQRGDAFDELDDFLGNLLGCSSASWINPSTDSLYQGHDGNGSEIALGAVPRNERFSSSVRLCVSKEVSLQKNGPRSVMACASQGSGWPVMIRVQAHSSLPSRSLDSDSRNSGLNPETDLVGNPAGVVAKANALAQRQHPAASWVNARTEIR